MDAGRLVNSYQEAIGRGNFEAARRLMDDNMVFEGPLETFHKPEPYLDSLKKLGHIVQRIEVKKIFTDSNEVCLLYDMVTNTPAGTALIAEWYRTKGDTIIEIRAIFDARPFATMFGKPGSHSA